MIHRGRIAAIACALLLAAGCQPASESESTTENTQPTQDSSPESDRSASGGQRGRPGRAVRANECPSQEFPQFFDAFMERIALQQAFTRWPLTSVSIDVEAQPEPAQVTRRINQGQARFPLLMTVARAAEDGMQLSVREMGNRRAMVTYAKPDTDHQVIYRFELARDCWYLTGIQDDSL